MAIQQRQLNKYLTDTTDEGAVFAKRYEDIVDVDIAAFQDYYQSKVNELMRLLQEADPTQLEQLRTDVDRVLGELAEVSSQFLGKSMTENYLMGMTEAEVIMRVAGLRFVPYDPAKHQTVLEAIQQEMDIDFAKNLTALRGGIESAISHAERVMLRKNLFSGTAQYVETTEDIRNILLQQGVDALIDRGGRTWTVDRYADMLARTKAMQAVNTGTVNRASEAGVYVYEITNNFGNACEMCIPWEGQLVSTGGEFGLPTIEEATSTGLFHPNCFHRLLPAVDEQYALETGDGYTLMEYQARLYDDAEEFAKTVVWRGEGNPTTVAWGEAVYTTNSKALAEQYATLHNFYAMIPLGQRNWIDTTEEQLKVMNRRVQNLDNLPYAKAQEKVKKTLLKGGGDGFRVTYPLNVIEYIDYSGKPYAKTAVPLNFDPADYWRRTQL